MVTIKVSPAVHYNLFVFSTPRNAEALFSLYKQTDPLLRRMTSKNKKDFHSGRV